MIRNTIPGKHSDRDRTTQWEHKLIIDELNENTNLSVIIMLIHDELRQLKHVP